MASSDQTLRGHETLASFRKSIPDQFRVDERWVREYNALLDRLEQSSGTNLNQFKVPQDALRQVATSPDHIASRQAYIGGWGCDREVLIHRLDAALRHLSD